MVRMTARILLILMILTNAVHAQQPETRRETVVVTGVYEPVAIDEVDRSVSLLSVSEQKLLSNTWIDFLKLDVQGFEKTILEHGRESVRGSSSISRTYLESASLYQTRK